MSYRDDREAAVARVSALEMELAEARRTLEAQDDQDDQEPSPRDRRLILLLVLGMFVTFFELALIRTVHL